MLSIPWNASWPWIGSLTNPRPYCFACSRSPRPAKYSSAGLPARELWYRFAASINEACCSFDSLAIGQTLLSSNQCDDVALHAAPVAVERVLLVVHARRRTRL